MSDTNQASSIRPSPIEPSSIQPWTSVQAYVLAVICLLVGIAAGWFIRGSQAQNQGPTAVQADLPGTPAVLNSNSGPQTANPAALRKAADAQAGPLLQQLNADPANAELLENLGNIYYDAQQFPAAIEYYQRVLKVHPENTAVRTDMATAYWYTGKADEAIAEFQKSLAYEPNKANTLFNLGIVEWQGKMDIEKAVATWQKLLDTNPNYEGKDKVLELMAQAKKHSGVRPGTPAKPLP
ncbi:MAG: tetratricopeptide repeat protein [Terriglobales bacterium]